MVFNEFQETLQVWRRMPPSGLYDDAVWTLFTTISGRIEPISVKDSFLNDQTMANATDIALIPYEYRDSVQTGDGVIDTDGIQRKIIGQPERWKWMIPHVVCTLERAQWDLGG